jgi:YidC/Oxa1 family membrane protein insertase
MDQRRLVLTFLIIFGVLLGWERFLSWYYPKATVQRPAADGGAPAAPAIPEPEQHGEVPPYLAAPGGEELVRVETDAFRATLTGTGARLSNLELKRFRQTVAPDSPLLDLVGGGLVLPGTLDFGGTNSDAAFSYRAEPRELVLHGDERGEVTFVAEAPNGMRVEKQFAFSGDGYVFDLRARVSGELPLPAFTVILTPISESAARGGRTPGQELAVTLSPEATLVEKAFKDLQKQPFVQETPHWAGFAAQYFLAALLPREGTGRAEMSVAGGVALIRLGLPAADGQTTLGFYIGPKEQAALARAGNHLDRALDFGKFWFIAIPLLNALRFLHGAFGNYGIAIIVLTALVKLVTVPLTRTTFRNMREMQKLQPQMAKLRERFKDDQTALQKETMELYKRHRVNPLSGCLPMVLQIPIFMGLYNALYYSIELRHASFAMWINDLSAPDRLMVGSVGIPVLTLLMGASMLLQQRLTPQQGDPTQQRMMMFMPIIFTFMFINFPAGLVLYWLVNNVLTIGQQYLMMRSAN